MINLQSAAADQLSIELFLQSDNSKIKFQIAKLSNAMLVVFDVLGQVVAILVNEQLQPGTYEVDFDGSKLASGVYYYRIAIHSDKLIVGDFSETKKMLMIK
jgi:hypothetical protein